MLPQLPPSPVTWIGYVNGILALAHTYRHRYPRFHYVGVIPLTTGSYKHNPNKIGNWRKVKTCIHDYPHLFVNIEYLQNKFRHILRNKQKNMKLNEVVYNVLSLRMFLGYGRLDTGKIKKGNEWDEFHCFHFDLTWLFSCVYVRNG